MGTITNYHDRSAWLEARRGGIGSSDAAAILGQSKWASPYSLWVEKVHGVKDDDEIPEHIRWGTVLEAPIREEYQRRTGRTVSYAGPHAIVRSEQYPWLASSLDGVVEIGADVEQPRVFECKTAGAHKSGDWDVEPPLPYLIQTQHQMLVTGMDFAAVACLVGGQKLVCHDVPRNQAFIDAMLEHLREFWRRVELKDPPPIDGGEATTRVLKLLHPADNGTAIELPEAAGAKWIERDLIAEEIKSLEARKSEIDNWFRAHIGDCTYGTCRGETWSMKTQERAEHVVRASTCRVLRKVKGK